MNVLFVCVGNSGRSVMAERLFRQAAGGRHAARSAGADPRQAEVESTVLEALKEVGIDASEHVPHKLDDADVAWPMS
jgi:protein-tyrosine-phosphatase